MTGRGSGDVLAFHDRKGLHVVAPSFRQSEILDIARAEGRVEVDDLANRFRVTLQTIRRDLGELAGAGKLDRVHGGAVLRAGVANIGYEERRLLNADAKAAIARVCATQIPDNSSIFLNIGTTTEAVARALVKHRNLTVVTNNLNVAAMLAGNESCDVIVAGGVLRRSDGGLTGDLTTEAIAHFKVDLAVIGTSAIDTDGDLLDYDLQEVRVSRAILRQARASCVVADHSKLERSAPVRIASLSEVDQIITDIPLPSALNAKCQVWKTTVLVASE
jgi:DeoR family glycerol-3-phosphate regulon repressor